VTHVFWDWNGTLLDDTQAAVDTLNAMLARRGGRPVAMDYYRDHFAFPVRPFYESIGVCLENEDWDALAREYHDTYAEQPKRLNPEAVAALERAKAAGARQSVISALRQDLLEAALVECGVRGFFDYVYGVDNLDGRSKADRAKELFRRVAAEGDASDVVVIGDALHDKEVADALGVRCVLCAQGSHAAWRLRAVAPTGDTLLGALDIALRGRCA
jgi:phosphoglycolate phosphatase